MKTWSGLRWAVVDTSYGSYSGQHGYDPPPVPTEYLPFSQDSLPPEAGGM